MSSLPTRGRKKWIMGQIDVQCMLCRKKGIRRLGCPSVGWGLVDRKAVDTGCPCSSSLPLPLHKHFPLLCSTHSYPPRRGSSVKSSLAKSSLVLSALASFPSCHPSSILKQASVGDHTTPWGGTLVRLCDSARVRVGLSSPLCPDSPEQ